MSRPAPRMPLAGESLRMAKKVLVPVLPTERFYDAVVAAADVVHSGGGGLIVFLFTNVRPPQTRYEADGDGWEDATDIEEELDDETPPDITETWRELQIQGLEEARQLLLDRGIDERNIDYAFADYAVPRAEAIVEETA